MFIKLSYSDHLFAFLHLSEALVSFATDLQIKMSDATSLDSLVLDRRTLDALDNHLRRLPLPSSSSPTVSSRLQLDSTGTALWNACSRLTGLADGKEMEEDKLSLLCRGLSLLVCFCA